MTAHSQRWREPSARKLILKPAAMAKKPTSRIKLLLATLKGRTIAIEPLTTALIKPINSPIARLPLCELNAAKVEKTSGLPFPNAKNVTPARLSLIPNKVAIVLRLMHRKSLAAMPIVLKRRLNHRSKMIKAPPLA